MPNKFKNHGNRKVRAPVRAALDAMPPEMRAEMEELWQKGEISFDGKQFNYIDDVFIKKIRRKKKWRAVAYVLKHDKKRLKEDGLIEWL